MIVSNYTKLFSIEFLHDAYRENTDLMRDISIVPDEETIQIMNGNRLTYKFDKNTFFCFVQTIATVDTTGGTVKVTTENKPLINFDEKALLSFKVIVNSGQFLNNSNLRLFDSKNKIFRFSNDSGNKHITDFYLSKKIPDYAASENYTIGMLAANAGNIFEAIKESGVGNVHHTTENLFWKNVTDTQFVNQKDLVDDTENQNCFGTINILFKKDLVNQFNLLKKSNVPSENNKILGKEFIIHFKNNAVN